MSSCKIKKILHIVQWLLNIVINPLVPYFNYYSPCILNFPVRIFFNLFCTRYQKKFIAMKFNHKYKYKFMHIRVQIYGVIEGLLTEGSRDLWR